ncbi:MAG: 16S rRNA (adenine(1518)-N(6)/adenine(1519)-N(6))-dimethyltransferase RsmA [Halobacteriovoraceae bacterium]|nr:16S rRNA (adenine(1518)-N(6)/adenine(1519)-N(6))-dimethyltransferase RsmA [Halobacteriovoraceae bacterium]
MIYTHANKKLGQHFLRNEKICSIICSDFAKKAQSIIEVGPGKGVLTKKLAFLNLPIRVIEKDHRFKEILNTILPEDKIIWDNALDVNLNQIFPDKQIWMVSNLPYNMATPLLIKFLKTSRITMMTLMFQKEVGIKIIKTMGSLMALCNNYFICRPLIEVKAKDFSPPPKVDSLVVSFERKKNPQIPLAEFKSFESFLRKLFSQRRKQVINTLNPYYKKEKILKTLGDMQIDYKKRAETFDLDQIQQLYFKL